jgi:small subunit ribosomal protein S3
LGQKVNPIGLRLGINREWDSCWFAGKKDFGKLLLEDLIIRKYVQNRFKQARVSNIKISRTAKRITIDVFTARPGIIIGRKGVEADKLRDELQHLTQKEVNINIKEIKTPEIDSYLVAESIARQLEQRIYYKRAMKKAISLAIKMGAEGIRIRCSGRLGGSEIARTEAYMDGRIPLHTLRADIDYATATAMTTYGTIGVKVWIFKGEIIGEK